MKCPNCAAPREPWECLYCGDEDSSLRPKVHRGVATDTAVSSCYAERFVGATIDDIEAELDTIAVGRRMV